MALTYDLSAHVCVVTGGGAGIGRAIAAAFAEAGARVVITGRRESALRATADALGPRVTPLVHDVADVTAAPGIVDTIEESVGPISTLVNNAGVHQKVASTSVDPGGLDTVLSINASGAFFLTQAVIERMAARGSGDVQFVSSMAALFGIPLVAAYTMAKGAVTALTRQLAVEFGPLGIRFNAIAPGFIETEMSRAALESDPVRRSKVLGRTPLGRLGLPDEMGALSVFLASPAASYITGAMIPVDGGASVGF